MSDVKTMLTAALELARKYPIGRPDIAEQRTPGYLEFLSLAFWLQHSKPQGEPIILPTTALSWQLKADVYTISVCRRWAVEDGFLVEVGKANHKKGLATRFRYTGPAAPTQQKEDDTVHELEATCGAAMRVATQAENLQAIREFVLALARGALAGWSDAALLAALEKYKQAERTEADDACVEALVRGCRILGGMTPAERGKLRWQQIVASN